MRTFPVLHPVMARQGISIGPAMSAARKSGNRFSVRSRDNMDDKRRRFEALAMPHLDAATNLARWLTKGGAEADDIVQDAMLRAYRSFDGFRGEAVKPWLLTIVRNCHRDVLEQRKRHAAAPLEEEGETQIAADDPTPEGEAIQQGASRLLDKAIARCPWNFVRW